MALHTCCSLQLLGEFRTKAPWIHGADEFHLILALIKLRVHVMLARAGSLAARSVVGRAEALSALAFRPQFALRHMSSIGDIVQSVIGKPDASKQKPDAEKAPADAKCGPTDDDDDDDMVEMVDPSTGEWGGPTKGGTMPEPTRFGDWERKGRCSDFS
jgi:hypothetical protein